MATNTDRGLWDHRSVRELSAVACLLIGAYLAYRIRTTLIPIGAAFLLSYAVEPQVRILRDRFRVPRLASAALCLIVFIAVVTIFWVWAGPRFAAQLNDLIDNAPGYLDVLRDHLGVDDGAAKEFIERLRSGDPNEVQSAARLGDLVVAGGTRLFGFVGTVTAASVYLVLAVLLVLVFFVIFVTFHGWQKHLEWIIPKRRHALLRTILGHMDKALGAYVRGQLLVALFTFTGFLLGFFLIGVPYWFVVALIGGLFSLVPYGQLLGLIGAVVLLFLESMTGGTDFSWWTVLLAPLVVYSITQSMESWVITPLVQGEINKLHPAVILIVLIIGGSLAGALGLILAIPIAATVRASVREFAANK